MKIFKKYTVKSFLLLLAIIAISCNDDVGPDDLFEEDSAIRLEQEEQEVRDLLTASEYGWKITYFTDDSEYTGDDQQLGGWSFIFNFTDEKNVTMVSDFSEETLTPKESEYDIKLGSTIKLSFATANYIHLLSDANSSPNTDLTGQGYKGDFEFLFYGQDGEDLIFKSNREQIELRFEPATTQDWVDIEENVEDILPILDYSVYGSLAVNDNGEEKEYDFAFDYSSRYARVLIPGTLDDISFGIGLKPDGISIRPGVELQDQIVTEFDYNEAENRFVGNVEGGSSSVILTFNDQPTPIPDDYEDFNDFQQYGYLGDFNGATNVYPTSGRFISLFGEVRNDLFENEEVLLNRIYFINQGTNQYLFFDMEDIEGTDLSEPLFVNASISNQKIVIQSIGWNNDEYEEYLQPLVDVFVHSEGMYLERLDGTFQALPRYTFTSAESPNMRVTMLAFE